MKNNVMKLSKVPLIGDMLFSLLSLPLVLSVQDIAAHTPDNPDIYTLFPAALFFMGIARLFRALRYRRDNRFQFIRYLVFGIALMGCLPLCLALGETKNTLLVLSSIYWGLLAVDRIVSVIRDHSLRNILLNLLALFMLVFVYVGFVGSAADRDIDGFILVAMFVAMGQTLLSIMTVAFSRINLRVLGNVIRQSYVTEVLLGLVLLIVSFSYCLKSWEPAITSLADGIWYCFAIVTTIGFGDITATTIKGRILSIILGMYGIVVVSLITSIIVNFYGEMKRENADEIK